MLMQTGFYRTPVRAAAPAGGRTVVAAAWLALAWVAAGAGAAAAVEVRCAETRQLMGVPWTITVYAASPQDGAAAIAAGFAEIARLERILSDYDPQSELSRLSLRAPTSAPVELGVDLWRVLSRAVEIRDATEAAFDPTVGPLTSLWRQARRTGRLPTVDRLSAARQAVGPATLRLVPENRAVSLERPGMRLDLGGIGMGYAVDRTLEVLGQHGIEAALVDASGDIGASGPPPGSRGWTIEVSPLRAADREQAEPPPVERLVLIHQAVTTSGDAFQAAEIGGRRYSHVVDPRTGIGVAGPAAATVVAADCTTADALATAASVLGPGRALPVLARFPGVSARLVWLENGRISSESSPSWSSQVAQIPE
jgi:thiamine biosynthesis lipoprotein